MKKVGNNFQLTENNKISIAAGFVNKSLKGDMEGSSIDSPNLINQRNVTLQILCVAPQNKLTHRIWFFRA